MEESSDTTDTQKRPTALLCTVAPKGKAVLLPRVMAGMSPLQGMVADQAGTAGTAFIQSWRTQLCSSFAKSCIALGEVKSKPASGGTSSWPISLLTRGRPGLKLRAHWEQKWCTSERNLDGLVKQAYAWQLCTCFCTVFLRSQHLISQGISAHLYLDRKSVV